MSQTTSHSSSPAAQSPVVRSRVRRRALWSVALLVVLLSVTGVVVAVQRSAASDQQQSSSDSLTSAETAAPDRQTPASASASPRETATPDVSSTAYTGVVVPVSAERAVPSCQAAASRDAGGRPVSYAAKSMSDGDPSTAWRCNGNGVGESVVFNFRPGTRLAAVGLVNGYSKVDPVSGEQRYGEYRRITTVTWSFPNGATYTEQLKDRVTAAQTFRIPVQETDQVTMTILDSTEPGRTSRSRDAVFVAEASFATPLS